MSWRASSVHHERQEFVCLAEQEGGCFSQLCLRFGISRKTGYKWRERARQGGGLQDMSCKPHHSPKQNTPAVEAAVLEIRDRHPAWGGSVNFILPLQSILIFFSCSRRVEEKIKRMPQPLP
jgi:transposase-like protein